MSRGHSFPRAFERRTKISFYQKKFYEEIETCKRGLWKWIPLSIRAATGEPGRGSFSRTF